MQPFTCGTSRERIIRTALMTLLLGVFAAAFLRDGYGGYARKNADELAASLGLAGDHGLVINEKFTKAEGVRLASSFTDVGGLAGIKKSMGDPTLERDDAYYFVGPGGHLLIETKPGRPAQAAWVDGGRSETDQAIQRLVGLVLTLVTLVFLVQLLRVLATRTRLSEAGLKLPGHAIIPLDDIRTLGAAGTQGAAIELGFVTGGQTRTVVLDPYVIGRLNDLVAAISEARGISSPLKGAGT